MQCPSKSRSLSQYENCTGLQAETYYPLQYQGMPFHDGRPLSSSPPTFTASRLYMQPTLKSCHATYSGEYVVFVNITSPFIVLSQNTYIFYPNGFFFSACSGENNMGIPCSNLVGVWDCDGKSKNFLFNRTYFTYPTSVSQIPLIYYGSAKLTCAENRCDGVFSVFGFPLGLPINGVLSGTPNTTAVGSIALQKLSY